MIENTTSSIVSHQWAKRPSDERFTSLTALGAAMKFKKEHSKEAVFANRDLTVVPSTIDNMDVAISGPNGGILNFTHWSFGQLSGLAGVPAGYLRDGLPGALIADNLNWGLKYRRNVEEIGTLRRKNGGPAFLAAATGPDYGRIWDSDVVDTTIQMFGDGVTGDFKVPGEFGINVPITEANTTIYGSDRDIWFFLADEKNRVEVPRTRFGKTETNSVCFGFYASNSEVGFKTLTGGMFLFDYACMNRILWGVSERHTISIRHTKGAPHRWREELKPVLHTLANRTPDLKTIRDVIVSAQNQRLNTSVDEFLSTRFGKGMVAPIKASHEADEGRPIEFLFDVVTGATAYARSIPFTDQRVAVERIAGGLLTAPKTLPSQVAY